MYQFSYVKYFSTNQNGNLLLLDGPGRVRSQITSVMCQIQRFGLDCNLVVARKVRMGIPPGLGRNPSYVCQQSASGLLGNDFSRGIFLFTCRARDYSRPLTCTGEPRAKNNGRLHGCMPMVWLYVGSRSLKSSFSQLGNYYIAETLGNHDVKQTSGNPYIAETLENSYIKNI